MITIGHFVTMSGIWSCWTYLCTWVTLILAGVVMVTSDVAGQCRLDNGQCVYRVELVQGHCGNENALPGVGDKDTHPVQSDSNKIVDIEKTLQYVKVEHSKMISELQNRIDQMSSGMVGSGSNIISSLPQPQGFKVEKIQASGKVSDHRKLKVDGSDEEDLWRTEIVEEEDLGIPLDPNRTENSLLQELHEKFTKLRLELLEARRRLRDAEKHLLLSRSQLNKTEETLKVTNEALKKSEENLLETEAKRKNMSKLLLKKDKETNVIRNKLKHCRKQMKSKDIRIWELDSDLDKLQEQLAECQEELKMTKLLLERALIKYHDLNVRHDNVTRELNETKKALTQEKARQTVTSYCGFEDPDICGFVKDNSTNLLEWIQWSLATPSHWTGPEGDHTCGNGQVLLRLVSSSFSPSVNIVKLLINDGPTLYLQLMNGRVNIDTLSGLMYFLSLGRSKPFDISSGHYMYVEATAQASDRKARLISPHHAGDNEQCVEFYYHMYGRNIGTLNVILIVQNRTYEKFPPPVWRAYGNQGNVWTMARLPVPQDVATKGYQVVFEVFTAAGYAGDIAIDDVRVFVGECYGSETLSQWRTKQRNHMLDVMREG